MVSLSNSNTKSKPTWKSGQNSQGAQLRYKTAPTKTKCSCVSCHRVTKTRPPSSSIVDKHKQNQQKKAVTSAEGGGNASSNARTTCDDGDVITPITPTISAVHRPPGVDRCAVMTVYNELVSLIRHDHNVEAIRYLRECAPPLRAAVLRLHTPEVNRPIIHLAVDADSHFLLELLLRTYNVRNPDFDLELFHYFPKLYTLASYLCCCCQCR